jgi:hypothetical protein
LACPHPISASSSPSSSYQSVSPRLARSASCTLGGAPVLSRLLATLAAP